uniref:Uncharacterized protein n=1 Tax=mine drainage metagenome TaxID=410659 RepID=E6QHI9_9ZZZZ
MRHTTMKANLLVKPNFSRQGF